MLAVLASALIIARACDGFEVAADYLGRNMSEGVKGATINAVGSSMPELFATAVFLFVFFDVSGFAGGIGTTAGSAVFNTMIIPAVSVIAAMRIFRLASVPVSKKVILRDGLVLLSAEFVLILLIGDTLDWWHGLILMSIYILYVVFMLTTMKQVDGDNCVGDEDEDEGEDESVAHGSRLAAFVKLDLEYAVIGERPLDNGSSARLLGVATLFIAAACYLLVLACESLGLAIGIQGYFVAVILAAAASSVPDTILSVKDAKKGNYDDAVSNALGSNIFDICFALGLPLFIYTCLYGEIVLTDTTSGHITELRLLLFVLTALAFLVFYLGSGIGKFKAYVLLLLYFIFAGLIAGSAVDAHWAREVMDPIATWGSMLRL